MQTNIHMRTRTQAHTDLELTGEKLLPNDAGMIEVLLIDETRLFVAVSGVVCWRFLETSFNHNYNK